MRIADLSDTKDYFSVSNDDLNLYFEGTFLHCLDTNQWEHVYGFTGESHSNTRTIMTDKCSVGRQVRSSHFNFGFPDIGLYNYKNGVVSFRRRSHRQNKKGLCSGTADILNALDLYDRFIEIPYGPKIIGSWKWLSSNVNKMFAENNHTVFENAYEEVRKQNKFARAVNHNFFIGQGIKGKEPSFWFRQTLIGFCPDPDQIVIENDSFLQETLDQFVPMGIEIDATHP